MDKGKLQKILTILILVVLCTSIPAISLNTLRFHPLYRQGMSIVKTDPAVSQLIGAPIRSGLYVLGSTKKFFDGGGSASLRTPISGSDARGILSIMGTQTSKDGPWHIVMTVQIDQIDTLMYSSADPALGFQLLQK